MSDTPDQQFQQILDDARADPYVLGMCLGGSRGKGYEGRHRPYYGYLERELRTYPLTSIPLSGDQLLTKIDVIAASADRVTQQELLAMVDALLRPAGFGDVFDSWEADYQWMQNFQK